MQLFRFWKSVCWFIIILIATFLPGSSSKRIRLFIHADKVIHLTLFVVFTLLLIVDSKRFFQTSSMGKNILLTVIITGLMVGLFTELVQYYFIADRSGSIADFIADICGVAVGFGLYKILSNRLK